MKFPFVRVFGELIVRQGTHMYSEWFYSYLIAQIVSILDHTLGIAVEHFQNGPDNRPKTVHCVACNQRTINGEASVVYITYF